MLKGNHEHEELLRISDLDISLKNSKRNLKVINGVSLTIHAGEALGLVGESGSGKSALALSIVGLLPNSMVVSGGRITYRSQPLHEKKRDEIRRLRGKEISMIFQDPMTSLNPSLTVGEQIMEMFAFHLGMNRKEAKQQAVHIMKKVGLSRPEDLLKEYPHRLSGGMRQRVMIAIALACHPKLLIADEPTTALDVTIQAQILQLMEEVKKEGTALLFISHDMGVIAEICDRVAVMYAGQIVEEGTVQQIFASPQHPYTIGLLNSIPTPNRKNKRLYSIRGTVPAISDRGAGCPFHSRCDHAMDVCFSHDPEFIQTNERQLVRCFLVKNKGGDVHAGTQSSGNIKLEKILSNSSFWYNEKGNTSC